MKKVMEFADSIMEFQNNSILNHISMGYLDKIHINPIDIADIQKILSLETQSNHFTIQ